MTNVANIQSANIESEHTLISIPQYLVRGFSDRGAERWVEEGNVQNDDLRVTIELQGNVHFIIPDHATITVDEKMVHISVIDSVSFAPEPTL